MNKVKLYNFQTHTYDEIASDTLTAEQGLSYVPIEIETVEENYREYIRIGLSPFEAVRMTTYEALLAFRAILVDMLELNSTTQEMDLLFLGENTPQARIRMLIDFDDSRAVAMPWHKNYEEKVDRPCREQFGLQCDDCASSNKKTRNNEDVFAWPVWDYEAQRVRILVGRQNNFTIVGKLFEYYEERGTILGRDFIVKRVPDEKNKQFTKYALVPEDPSPFRFEEQASIPGSDTIMKTIILARDPELAEALGISTEERLGTFLERELENEG